MNEFIDRNTQYPNRKILNIKNIEYDNNGEISKLLVDAERSEGEVYQEGTALKSENLNTIIRNIANECISIYHMSEAEKVAFDKSNLNISTQVQSNFSLPQTGKAGTIIVWNVISGTGITISGNTAIVTKGLVIQNACLRATISCGNANDTKDFNITILEKSSKERVIQDKQNLTIPTDVVSSFDLPTRGECGSSITWVSTMSECATLSNNRVIVNRGTENNGVILIANINYGNVNESKEFAVRLIGTDCYNPKTFSTSWAQQDGSLKSSTFDINTSNLEGLYVELENLDDDNISTSVITNSSTSVRVKVLETLFTNSSHETGSATFRFNVKVYLSTNHSLLLGTIPCTINYYYLSQTPDD